jgi:hypothetical protein
MSPRTKLVHLGEHPAAFGAVGGASRPCRRSSVVLPEQRSMYRQDGRSIEAVSELDRRLHRSRVGDDLGGVAPRRVTKFRERNHVDVPSRGRLERTVTDRGREPESMRG